MTPEQLEQELWKINIRLDDMDKELLDIKGRLAVLPADNKELYPWYAREIQADVYRLAAKVSWLLEQVPGYPGQE
jgi:hypothetical protein